MHYRESTHVGVWAHPSFFLPQTDHLPGVMGGNNASDKRVTSIMMTQLKTKHYM